MASHKLLVFTNPTEGQEQEYNDWYDNVHLQDLLKVPGITGAQRFVAEPGSDGAPGPYLALYDLEGDPKEVTAELGERVKSGEIQLSPAVDMSRLALWTFRAAGPHRPAE